MSASNSAPFAVPPVFAFATSADAMPRIASETAMYRSSAASASEAIAAITADAAFDLVISDVTMPVTTGVQLHAQLVADGVALAGVQGAPHDAPPSGAGDAGDLGRALQRQPVQRLLTALVGVAAVPCGDVGRDLGEGEEDINLSWHGADL